MEWYFSNVSQHLYPTAILWVGTWSSLVEGDEQLDRPNSQTTTTEFCLRCVIYFLGFNTNTTAFCLGQYSIHLLLLKSSMVLSGSRSSSSSASSCPATFMIQFDTINLAKFRPLPIFLKVYLVFCKTLI